MKVAILIDGGFFIKRYRSLYKNAPQFNKYDPVYTAKILYKLACRHLIKKEYEEPLNLYRVFYYDCKPFEKRIHNPISMKNVNFANTPEAKFRNALFHELKRYRKVALRISHLKEREKNWIIYPRVTKDLLQGNIKIEDVTENNIYYPLIQKGVDMKIGLDIAALAYKKQVDRIVLFTGDSDFVPAAKVARREGIDFILDPMWSNIEDSLSEHIDGLYSTCYKPRKR